MDFKLTDAEKKLVNSILEEKAARIIACFEDLLEEYNITIPDKFRDEANEDEARIYGDNYYKLEDSIKEILKEFIGGWL